MIERYTNPEMGHIWALQHEFEVMLEVEITACEAMAQLGEIPVAAARNIRQKAKFNLERVKEIEKVTNHDIIAFLTNVAEYVGEDSKYIHKGLTSTDVKDTALGIMMKKSADIIIDDIKKLRSILLRRAKENRYTVCIGRTHGVHAEPMTFGLKFLLWYEELGRDLKRLESARESVAVGKLSGAIGTYSNIDPRIEEIVCHKLGLTPAPISTQVIQRDRHAEYLTALAITASSLEKFATEIRSLQRTELREAEEFFSAGQKGSSAMPHKRNPVTCERISGLARLVRGNAVAAMEDITLWHERDISHSSVERVILPDSTIIVDYCLQKFTKIVDKLLLYPENMLKNLNKTGGLIYSQRVLLAIVDKGVLREDAYKWVQRNAMKKWLDDEDFKTNIINDPDIKKYLTPEEIAACFDCQWFLRHINTIFKRYGLE